MDGKSTQPIDFIRICDFTKGLVIEFVPIIGQRPKNVIGFETIRLKNITPIHP